MFNIAESQELYMQLMLERTQKMIDKINGYSFVSNAYLDNQGIRVEFIEEVDLENQDIFDLFLKGGAIKKADSKDNEEEQYFLVEPIGEF